MAKAKFDTEKAFKNIIGIEDEKKETEQAGDDLPWETGNDQPAGKGPEGAERKTAYVQQMVYITPEQKKAIRLRIAMGEDPGEKDISAVVRRAIDAYLEGKG